MAMQRFKVIDSMDSGDWKMMIQWHGLSLEVSPINHKNGKDYTRLSNRELHKIIGEFWDFKHIESVTDPLTLCSVHIYKCSGMVVPDYTIAEIALTFG